MISLVSLLLECGFLPSVTGGSSFGRATIDTMFRIDLNQVPEQGTFEGFFKTVREGTSLLHSGKELLSVGFFRFFL